MIGDFLDERLPNNVVMLQTICKMHALNRVTIDLLNQSKLNVVNPIFSLSHLLHIGSYMDKFVKSCVNVALRGFEWSVALRPDLEHDRRHHEVVGVCVPDLHLAHARAQKVSSALQVLNGDWSKNYITHICTRLADGSPCCSTREMAMSKTRDALVNLLLLTLPPVFQQALWGNAIRLRTE
jgi:hypothetical protein